MLELLQLDCLWFGIACLAGSQAGIITECCLHQVNKQPDKTVKFKPHRSLSLGADWHMVHSLAHTDWNHRKLSFAATKWPVWPVDGTFGDHPMFLKIIERLLIWQLPVWITLRVPIDLFQGLPSNSKTEIKFVHILAHLWKTPCWCHSPELFKNWQIHAGIQPPFFKDHQNKRQMCLAAHEDKDLSSLWKNIGHTNTRPDPKYSNLFWNLAKGRRLHRYI